MHAAAYRAMKSVSAELEIERVCDRSSWGVYPEGNVTSLSLPPAETNPNLSGGGCHWMDCGNGRISGKAERKREERGVKKNPPPLQLYVWLLKGEVKRQSAEAEEKKSA